MRSLSVFILLAVNALLGFVLGQQWLDGSMHLRPLLWKPPVPKMLPASALAVNGVEFVRLDISVMTATTEKPLFFSSRRPPEPPPLPKKIEEVPSPPPPKPDPLSNLELYGLFSVGEGKGGVIARLDGRMQRFRFGDTIGEWTLKGFDGRKVVFVGANEELRELTMSYRSQPSVTKPAEAVASTGGNSAPPAVGATARVAPGTGGYEDAVIAYRARVNASRAKSGLPPIDRW